jgi:hypothetical protein
MVNAVFRYCWFVAGESPRRKHTTYRTRRKFEIKNSACLLQIVSIPFFYTSSTCQEISPHFMEPGGSQLCSLQPATCLNLSHIAPLVSTWVISLHLSQPEPYRSACLNPSHIAPPVSTWAISLRLSQPEPYRSTCLNLSHIAPLVSTWAISLHFMCCLPISVSTLLMWFCLCLGLPSSLLHPRFPPKFCTYFCPRYSNKHNYFHAEGISWFVRISQGAVLQKFRFLF